MCDASQHLPNIYQRLPANCEGIDESTFSLRKINITIAGELSAAVCFLLCAASLDDSSSLSQKCRVKQRGRPKEILYESHVFFIQRLFSMADPVSETPIEFHII